MLIYMSDELILDNLFQLQQVDSFNTQELEEVSKEVEKYQNVFLKGPKKIEGTKELVFDADPYKLPNGCIDYELPEIERLRTYLFTLIGGIDSNIIEKDENGYKKKYPLKIGSDAIPYDNVKIFKDITYEPLKYSQLSPIKNVKSLLEVDEIYPMLKKGKKINFDNFSENIDDDIDSTDSEAERCDVIFVKYLDDAQKIKVKVLFNPLCNQIGFFLWFKEADDKWVLCYQSFYKVTDDEIVFRPYSNFKPHIPKKTEHIKPRSLVNIIKVLNDALGDINFQTKYSDIINKINTQAPDVKTKFMDLIKDEYTFIEMKKSLSKKFEIYKEYTGEIKLDINNFETQFDIKKIGSDTLHPKVVKNIKRFCKLDSSFLLEKHKEIQQKLVSKEDIKDPKEVVFDIDTYMKEKILNFDKKIEEIKDEKHKELIKNKVRPNFIKHLNNKFKKQHEKNNKILVHREYTIYKPVDFTYFTPFTLSDILSARYRKQSLYEKLGLESQSLTNLFNKIENLRSYVFTFVSIYYDFIKKPSSLTLKRDSKGYIKKVNGKAQMIQDDNLLQIDLYNIYPNQFYSSPPISTKYIKYFTILERDGKRNDFEFLFNEANPKDPKPLKFLKLVEGIINLTDLPKYPYIDTDELFQPNLEKAIIRRDASAASEELQKLIKIEKNIEFVDNIDMSNLTSDAFFKIDPDASAPKLQGVWATDISPDVLKFVEITRQIENTATVPLRKQRIVEEEETYENNDDENLETINLIRGFRGEGQTHESKTKILVDNVFKKHLNYLITVPQKKNIAAKNYDNNRKEVERYIESIDNIFDKELAKKLLSVGGKIKAEIISLKIKQNLDSPLDNDKVNILTNFFSDNTKKIKDAFVGLLKINNESNKILNAGAPDKPAPSIILEDDNLIGNKSKITNQIYSKIFDTLKNIVDNEKANKKDPLYQANASLFFTIIFTGNKKISRNYQQEIKSKLGDILDQFRQGGAQDDTERGIANDLVKSDVDKNINGINKIIEILGIVKIPYVYKEEVVNGATQIIDTNIEEQIQEKISELIEIEDKSKITNDDTIRYVDLFKQLTNLAVANGKSIEIYKVQIKTGRRKKIQDKKLQNALSKSDKEKYMKYKLKYLKLKELLNK